MEIRNINVPSRLVICVDGTQRAGRNAHTSISRLHAGIKHGRCIDNLTQQTFNQVPKYVPGIGSADDVFSKDRLQNSIFGQGYLKQVQDVYESCCQLTNSKDEVWLFGFGRGAYVVRAVAGLLHHCNALASAGQPEFSRDWKRLIKDLDVQSGHSSLALSPVSTISHPGTRPGPKIRFVGVFDTVKAGNDSMFDISFNASIQHMRHALALHEDRKALAPEVILTEEFYQTQLRESKRSFIQAYFTGNHVDVGGASKRAGLGLYPLQWMLIEAKACGLTICDESISRDWASNPLSVVFPRPSKKFEGTQEWSCHTANGITVTMHNLREVHSLAWGDVDFAVKLNTRSGSIRQKKYREAFTNIGGLQGYCDWAPQGSIIHPSVYMLLDEHTNVALQTKELRLQRNLEDWRERMLGSHHGVVNTGFWLDEDDEDDLDPGAIRILVCGNTGVGKSTLINKTFGSLTTSSNRTRGIHDVREEITFEGRPDLILHDSGGFEAGADDEMLVIEEFLKEKSATVDVMDRLHVIWFCVDINSPRTLQTATEKLFRAISQYANDVPIVVVATKKDDFIDLEFSARRKAMKKEGKRFDEEECERYAEEKLRERMEVVQSEMESVPGGRLDACIAVSSDDDDSIANLSKTTSQCFDTDKVRLLYIRAQVTRIDLKVDMAVSEVIMRYKKLLKNATGSTFAPVPMGSTIHRKVSTKAITKAIVNCFGLPTVSADAALTALQSHVWSTVGMNLTLALAETLHIVAMTASGFMAGIPIWLATGALNSSYVVPATCRLFLIMSCDLILVLARSFRELAFRANGQPTERDVIAAARNYQVRGYAQHVHDDIKRLVPRQSVIKSFKVDAVQQGVEAIFAKYKDKLMEDIDLPLVVKGVTFGSEAGDDTSTEADSIILQDIAAANQELAELEGRPLLAELDGSSSMVELPADNKMVSELEGSTPPRKNFSLPTRLSSFRKL